MMKYFSPAVAALLLVACADTQSSVPAQKTQKAKVSAMRSLDMESSCKGGVVQRYNTSTQKADVSGLKQFQGNYEMHGPTFRRKNFVCSFDAGG